MSSAFPSQNPNRASLLAGLRTGGVRPPQSAAPTAASFDPQQIQLPNQQYQTRGFMTSAVDGPNNSFASQQQQQHLNPYQFQQAMQLEMLKMQAMQAQQIQHEMLRQQQAQHQQQQQQAQQQQQRRASFQPPATAGPTGSFDLRSAAANAQMRRQPEQRLAPANADQVPMTARLDGKFGTRSTSMPLNQVPNGTTVISGGTSLGSLSSNNAKEVAAPSKSDSASSWRRGGSGNSALAALRERSASGSPSVKASPPPLMLARERNSPPPSIEVSSPPVTAPVTAPASGKRPKPLSFALSTHKPMIPEVLIDHSEAEEEADDASSSGSYRSSGHGSGKSSPTTSNELLTGGEPNYMNPPLSPREEATKKLYEGLGVGRPRSRNSDSGDAPPSPRAFSMNVQPPRTAALFPSHDSGFNAPTFPQSPFYMAPVPHTASLSGPNYSQHRLDRSANQPKRQPRGPPSNQEELGPLNFATRSPRLPSTASLVGSMQGLAVEAY